MRPYLVKSGIVVRSIHNTLVIALLDVGEILKVDEEIEMLPQRFLRHESEFPKRSGAIAIREQLPVGKITFEPEFNCFPFRGSTPG